MQSFRADNAYSLGRGCVCVIVLCFASACTSIGAMQKPVIAADVSKAFICPSAGEIVANEAKQGRPRGQHRDAVILGCVKAINAHYTSFKVQMHKEKTGFQLGADLLALGATTGATFASDKLAERLTALGAFSIGSGAAIDRNVFFQLALPAIESSMDAQRDKIMTEIVRKQKDDPDGAGYTLTMAGYELESYQAAGNIYGAVSELTKVANLEATQAQVALAAQTARKIDVGTVSILPADTQAREEAIGRRIRALNLPADQATVTSLAEKLKVSLADDMPIEDVRGVLLGGLVTESAKAASPEARAMLLSEIESGLPKE